MPFPTYRARRLRESTALRRLVQETRLAPSEFILPLFVVPGHGIRQGISSMPGQYHLSVDQTVVRVTHLKPWRLGWTLDDGSSCSPGLRSLEIRFPHEMFHVRRPASVPIDDFHETVGESAFFGQLHQFRRSPFRHVLLIGGVQKVASWQDAVVRPIAQKRFKILIRAHRYPR